MRPSKILIPTGAILIIFGMIFQYQGRGQLGPESSFMYYSKDWIYYGIAIIITGIITSGIGVFLLRKSSR
jgi:energy-converting hydrogenase Eha subunit E